ncbi:MAG: arylsulfatase A-like enzyme [Myxococcota bacterium]|jgi:arylsulfatase A-like enzyme
MTLLRNVMLLLFFAALVTGPANAESPTQPLRPIVQRLLHELDTATLTPALPARPLNRCLGTDKPAAANPYSPLPKALALHHQRLTTTGPQYVQVELRDALVVPTPQTLTFRVKKAQDALLRLGLRMLPCDTKGERATLTIRVGDRAKSIAMTAAAAPDARSLWTDLTHPLPEAAAGDIDVTLELSAETPGVAVALADPVVVARPSPVPPAQDVNVLLIIIDAVRADVLGPARTLSKTITPGLDPIFTEGVGFTQAFSVSNQTRPSTVALLTSQPPSIGQFYARSFVLAPWFKKRFYAGDPPLLTRTLARHGWRVETIGHNHFQWDSLPIGLDHGWDRATDFRRAPEDTPLITDEAIRFVDTHADERWFLAVNYTAPHTPYKPPEASLAAVVEALGEAVPKQGDIPRSYLGELAWVDQHATRLLAALEARGLDQRTLVIVTADHGEVMHHHHSCQSGTFKMPCHFSHGLTLYDEELNIPLGLRLPGGLPAGVVIERPISHLDVAPTVLGLLGLPHEPGHTGRSWADGLLDAAKLAAVDASPIYAEGRISAALREAGKKLIVHNRDDDIRPYARTQRWSKEGSLPAHEVFDLTADPTEKVNLVVADKTVAVPLLARLDAVRKALEERGKTMPAVGPAASDPVVPSTARRPAHPAWNVLRLSADEATHRVSVTVRVEGSFRCRNAGPGGTCTADDARSGTLVLSTEANGRPASVSFETEPWDAKADISIVLDGAPYPLERLRLGPYGLAMLPAGDTFETEATWRLATGRHAPHVGPGPAAVYLWRAPPGQDQPVAVDPYAENGGADMDSNLDGEVRRILEELGYVK